MPRKFETIWYLDKDQPRFAPFVRAAFLYNCRDQDLQPGGYIEKGQVVAGQCGFHVAEAPITGLSAPPVSFLPNRICQWQGFQLPCMALNSLPSGRVPRTACRHRHCVVADFTHSSEAEAQARSAQLPLLTDPQGRLLANLEVASIPRQRPERRATLL